MGFFNADLVLFTSMKEGVRLLKENLYIIDSINEDLVSDPFLNTEYGQKELERFRNFVRRNEITITTDHKPPKQVSYPCISIGLGPGKEDAQNRLSLGDADSVGTTLVDPESLLGSQSSPRVILGPVTPINYDPTTGLVTFSDDVSLKDVVSGQLVVDVVNQQSYQVQDVIDDQNLTIPAGSAPNLQNMVVKSSISQVGNTAKSVYCWENYTITAVAKDPVEALYTFQLAILILLRFKKDLFESRGFAIQTFSYDPLMEGDDGSPNLVWFRTISLSGRVQYKWSNAVSQPIDGVGVDLRVSDQQGDQTQSPPGVLEQAQKQGWSMPGDPSDNNNT